MATEAAQAKYYTVTLIVHLDVDGALSLARPLPVPDLHLTHANVAGDIVPVRHHETGIVNTRCPCRNGLRLCRHVVSALVALARVPDHLRLTTTTTKQYWGDGGMPREEAVNGDVCSAIPIRYIVGCGSVGLDEKAVQAAYTAFLDTNTGASGYSYPSSASASAPSSSSAEPARERRESMGTAGHRRGTTDQRAARIARAMQEMDDGKKERAHQAHRAHTATHTRMADIEGGCL